MRLRYIAVNLLNLFMAVVEGFLAFRFLLKLFGANASNAFVAWVYDMSAVLLEPFRGICRLRSLRISMYWSFQLFLR